MLIDLKLSIKFILKFLFILLFETVVSNELGITVSINNKQTLTFKIPLCSVDCVGTPIISAQKQAICECKYNMSLMINLLEIVAVQLPFPQIALWQTSLSQFADALWQIYYYRFRSHLVSCTPGASLSQDCHQQRIDTIQHS